MNDDLIKYIKLFLADGVISEKEKEIIFRKSEELGVPYDECQMILDSLVYESNAAKENPEKKIVKSVKVFEQRKVKRIKPALLNQEPILKAEIDKSNKLIEKLLDESKEPMSKLNDLDTQISKKNEALQNLISHTNDLESQLDKSTDLFFNKFKDEIFARFQSVPLYHNDHKMKGKNFQAAKSVLDKNGIAINAKSLFRSKLNSSKYQEKIHKYFLENMGYDNTLEKKKLLKRMIIYIIITLVCFFIFYFLDRSGNDDGGLLMIPSVLFGALAKLKYDEIKSGEVHFNTDDVNEALNSVEKSYDYSKVGLLFKCRELIKDSKQIIKKTTKYEDFIKKLKIK